MRTAARHNRPLMVFLLMAIALHLLMLLVPVAREVVRRVAETDFVRVELRRPPSIPATPQKRIPRPEPLESIPEPVKTPVEPTVVAEAKDVEPNKIEPADVEEKPTSTITSREIIARQFLMESANRQAYIQAIDDSREMPDYFTAEKTTLEDALNQPVLHLPFRDTRIYEVAYYENGVGGAMDRFWDTVTVPFGFTTKNNTRIQCAWVLIFAGCSWGHKTLFYREAEKRKDDVEERGY